MKIADVIKFFGYPSQSKEFNEYLNSFEILERPMFIENPTERINKNELGVSLIFRAKNGYIENWGPPKEGGEMIFFEIQVYSENNDSDFKEFAGGLPFNLTFQSTLNDVTTALGPSTVNHPSGPDNRVHVWYDIKGNSYGVCFLPKDRGISFVSIKKAALRAPVKLG
jgi:hypothetical protein